MNLYEVLIDDKILKDKTKIYNFLFDCQCALFFIDITSNESFRLIKDLLNLIKQELYPFLRKILVLNKLDLNHRRQVNFVEITDFFYENKELELDNIEISLKTEENLDKLLEKINIAINKIKNQIPINILYETDLNTYNNKEIDKELDSITIILVGDSSVGKSCFLGRYFRNQFSDEFLTTLGIDKQAKVIKIDNTEYRLTFWDTAGQERFRSLPKKYYINADGIFIFFDVTSEQSFKNVNYWVENIQTCLGNNEDKKFCLFLIGNKIDLKERVISREMAENYANNLRLKYYETSSKINLNVNEVVSRMILDCHMNISNSTDCFIKSNQNTLNNNKVNIKEPKQEEGSSCCGSSKNKKEKKENKEKTRESLATIKSVGSKDNVSEISGTK